MNITKVAQALVDAFGEASEEQVNQVYRALAEVHGKGIVHGATCEKKPHVRSGYLHGEDDDSPYMVDGLKYCGRCHTSL
jgi:hypothetical protein